MTLPLVIVDADVLGRQRTGDETYVRGLLAALAADLPTDLRLAAITRHPELVPEGVKAVRLAARSQTLRMAFTVPRLLRRLRPALVHFQHALPIACPHPSVLTVHDLSFERDRTVMGLRDRLVFRTAVPRSVRRADRVLAVSELTKRDLVELYRVPEVKIAVTPNGVDSEFTPDGRSLDRDPYVLFVGALQPRKDVTSAVEALALVGETAPRLVVVGPDKGGRTALEDAATSLGVAVELRGYVAQNELVALYRDATCLVVPSKYEGFGLPVLEAMASGTPVVATTAGSLPEIAGDAAILVEPGNTPALAGGIERAIADHERLRAAGLERAKGYSWAETARRTLGVYRELLA